MILQEYQYKNLSPNQFYDALNDGLFCDECWEWYGEEYMQDKAEEYWEQEIDLNINSEEVLD